MKLTHIGGPTVLIEAAGLRLLTDPTFDPPGNRYSFGKDNLDATGRTLLPGAGAVITTVSGAARLGGNARGLAPWQTTTVGGIEITATPCRHGPPLSHPIVGDVIGFALALPEGTLWISGDTVLYDGVREVSRLTIDTAILHLGGVRFPISGPARYTMTAHEAIELVQLLRPRRAIPVHYEGWAHFKEGRAAIEKELADAPEDVRALFEWLPL